MTTEVTMAKSGTGDAAGELSGGVIGGSQDDLPALAGVRSRFRLRLLTDATSPVPIFLGVLVAAAGFVMLGIGWADVAGTLNVGMQMPYLMSLGLPGVALVLVGLVLVNVGVRRQDAAERARQISALSEALRDLQSSLER